MFRCRTVRRAGVVVVGLLCALAATSCGDAHSHRTPSAGVAQPPQPHRDARRAHGRAGAGAPMALRALDGTLSQSLRASGPGATATAAVYDLSTGRWLYRHQANFRSEPASVEKLYTTTAVLRLLGPNARLQTDVYGVGTLGPGGVWHGDLYLKGGGDPTFGNAGFNAAYEQGHGPTAGQLAAKLVKLGIHRVTGRVIADESLFDRRRGGLLTGYKPDVPDFGGQLSALTFNHGEATSLRQSPAVFADDQFVSAMNTDRIRARAAGFTAVTPIGAQLLASVPSPPMAVLLKLMNVPSDDLFAEMLTKQLGVRYGGGEGSIRAGAGVISDTIASDYGIHPVIQDGSGLSRGDRSSPAEVVTLLRRLWGTKTGHALVASLPVVGRSGTVQGIAAKTAAAGNCQAKTGTLDNVTNLAGYCRARGGDTLAFAFFITGPENSVALPLIGDMVAAVARY